MSEDADLVVMLAGKFVTVPQAQRDVPFTNPRMISREEATGRCGLSIEQFSALVKEGVFPDRVKGTRSWDRKNLNGRLAFLKMKSGKVDPGYVYFMEMGEFIKIGYSTWPPHRRDALQSSNPYDIRILAAFPGELQNEQDLHQVFKHLRHRNEWFRKSPGLLAFIEWLKIVWAHEAPNFQTAEVVTLQGKRR